MVIRKKAIEDPVQIEKMEKLTKELWFKIKNPSLYVLAFIHRSIVNEKPDFAPEHNERLEFLWDAVLEVVITENLFIEFPEKPEWILTDIRSALVRGKNLAKISQKLNFSKYLILWKWEEKWWWRENNYLLANTVEAFIWALYLDLWLKSATEFINKNIYSTLPEILEKNAVRDYKTIIQEYVQAKFDITPTYEVISEAWLDHEKTFTVWIYFKKDLKWKWIWSSKKKAQEDAAKNLYLELTWK